MTSLEDRARIWLGTALALLLAGGILTLWVERQWAVSAVQVGIYLLAAAWLAGVALGGFELRVHSLLAPFAGAAALGCVQLVLGTTIYRWATGVAVLDWFTRLSVVFGVLQVAGPVPAVAERSHRSDRARPPERLLKAAVWFGCAIAILAVLQSLTTPDRVFWLFEIAPRAQGNTMGPFVYQNQFAAFIEILLPAALYLGLGGGRLRWGYLMAAGVFVASVFAAASRAGAALVIAEIVVVFLLMRRRLHWRTFVAAGGAALALAALFVAAVGWGPLRAKFDRPDQLSERRLLYASTVRMIADRPWLGSGLGTWSTAYPAYATFDDGHFDNQAHNEWLQWPAEGGVPMAVLMGAMAVILAVPAVRSVWGVGLLFVLVHALVDYPFEQRPVFGYFYFAMAGILVSRFAGTWRRAVDTPR